MTRTSANSPIEFFFEFASPYAYLAAQRIDDLAARHGREVLWKPLLLGAVFKETGGQPLTHVPLKGDYTLRDVPRCAREHGIPVKMPDPFPFAAIAACRAFYWLEREDPAKARALAKALYAKAFGEGGDISSAPRVVEVAEGLGIDGEKLKAGLQDPAIKEKLREVVATSVERKIFGAPFFFVDGEPFWGNDRLETIERWLESGGW